MNIKQRINLLVIALAIPYVAVVLYIRFTNAGLTDTQLFLQFWYVFIIPLVLFIPLLVMNRNR